MPAAAAASATISDSSGASEGAFITMVQPATIEGPILKQAMPIG
jgi:hypothetical protein